ncbi:hypothetical protein BJ741DRAFT_635385 [Chytriomyces cf. hyalinus JEL632]|nr:hypothetical protein BJ741DRAFT_635385 [Chytriomyces cf. hyalinus JEL632]
MTTCCDSTDLIVQSGHWVCLMCGCVDAPCLADTYTGTRQKKIHQWTSGLAMRSEGGGTIVQRSVTQKAFIAKFERIRERYNLPASIPQVTTWSQWNHLILEMKAQHCYLKRNTTRTHLKTACFYFAMLQKRVAVQKKLAVQMIASIGTRIPLPSLLTCSRFEMGFQIEKGPGNPVYVACASLTFFSHHVPSNVIVNKRSVVRATGYSDPKTVRKTLDRMVKHKREI